jgi:hypothetical protein
LRYEEQAMIASLLEAFGVIEELLPRWSVLGSILDRGQLPHRCRTLPWMRRKAAAAVPIHRAISKVSSLCEGALVYITSARDHNNPGVRARVPARFSQSHKKHS